MKQRIFSVDTEGPESCVWVCVCVGNCGIRVQDLGVQRHTDGLLSSMHVPTQCVFMPCSIDCISG